MTYVSLRNNNGCSTHSAATKNKVEKGRTSSYLTSWASKLHGIESVFTKLLPKSNDVLQAHVKRTDSADMPYMGQNYNPNVTSHPKVAQSICVPYPRRSFQNVKIKYLYEQAGNIKRE